MFRYARTVVKIRMYKAYYNLVHTEEEITEQCLDHTFSKFEQSLELDMRDFLFCLICQGIFLPFMNFRNFITYVIYLWSFIPSL